VNEKRDVRRCRTLLFVPGDKPQRFDKAAAAGADAIVIDLEDAVQPDSRAAARLNIVGWLESLDPAAVRTSITVRVNEALSPDLQLDLDALREVPHLDAVVLPKFGDEPSRDACRSITVPVIGIVESGAGLLGVSSPAPLPAEVVRLSYGAGDFAADTGAVWEADNLAVQMARCHVAWASAAHSLPGPVDTAFPWLSDPEGLRRETTTARSVGFRGKYCIHPDQVGIVARAIGPSPEDADWARRVVSLWDEQAGRGGAGAVRLDDVLVDEAVAKKARAIIADLD
jgi:citrate lyase beta subunit